MCLYLEGGLCVEKVGCVLSGLCVENTRFSVLRGCAYALRRRIV